MKQFLTTIVCILGLCGIQAAQAAARERTESSISMEYKMVEDEDLYRLMDFLDVYSSADSDTLDFIFFARQTCPDTVLLSWTGEGAVYKNKLPVPQSTHPILMETYSDRAYTDKDSIPIMAYSTGQPLEFEMNGEKQTFIDYCGLRDAKVHPREWPAKYGIKDFVYFYIIFPEE